MRGLLTCSLILGLLTAAASAGEPAWRTAEVVTITESSAYPPPRVGQILLEPAEIDGGRVAEVATWVEPASVLDEGRIATVALWTEPAAQAPIVRAQDDEPPARLPEPSLFRAGAMPSTPARWVNHEEPTHFDAPDDYYVSYDTVGSNRFFAGADFLLWWLKEGSTPALLTTGQPPSVGILAQPGTSVLLDGNDVTANPFCGGRFFAGFWLDEQQSLGIEGRGFFLGTRSTDFFAGTAGFPVLARPFFNLNDLRQFAETIGFPGVSTGAFALEAPSRLWGAEANVRKNLWCADCGWFDCVAGFRYLDLQEGLKTSEVVLVNRNPPPQFADIAGDTRVGVDMIDTENKFYGGQIGGVGEYRQGRLACQVRGTVAFGQTHETVTVAGAQLRVPRTGDATISPGNLLALPTNMGITSRNRFSVVPEVGLNLGYWVTDNVRVNLGYTFLYWSNVVRPGDQVDPVVDISQIPNFVSGVPFTGIARPTVVPNDTDIWAQGINAGLEFRW